MLEVLTAFFYFSPIHDIQGKIQFSSKFSKSPYLFLCSLNPKNQFSDGCLSVRQQACVFVYVNECRARDDKRGLICIKFGTVVHFDNHEALTILINILWFIKLKDHNEMIPLFIHIPEKINSILRERKYEQVNRYNLLYMQSNYEICLWF